MIMWRAQLILEKLWYGRYSLGRSLFGFFITGSVVMIIVGMVVGAPFIFLGQRVAASLAFFFVYWSYVGIAAVGTWRAANARLTAKTSGGWPAVLGSKLLILIWTVGMANAFYGRALRGSLGIH